jgi:hypothetical protein
LCKTRAGSAVTTNQLALDHGCGRNVSQRSGRLDVHHQIGRVENVTLLEARGARHEKEDFTLTSMIGMSAARSISIKPETPSSPTQVTGVALVQNATRVGAPNMLHSARNKPCDHLFCIRARVRGAVGGALRDLQWNPPRSSSTAADG